ncbi:MAG: dTMP kinase [Helicobacteraceae bacterium]|jgi:dTMP kinase|nr:dTMP kinase [Helicobacteraceae bacterium]
MYVAIEGVDYSGKTTQINALKECYKDAVFTREPGGTMPGEKLRDIALHHDLEPLTRMFLFLADRAEHIAKVVAPAIAAGKKLIVTDRSLISGVGYAWNEMSADDLMRLNLLASKQIKPDLGILLLIDEATMRVRMAKEKPDQIEKQGVEYLLKTQEHIRDAALKLGIEMIPINAGGDTDNITEEIREVIDDRLGIAYGEDGK